MTAPAAEDTGTRLPPGELALWLLQRLAPERGVANVAVCLTPPGALRWWPLREALAAVVDRHPALRGCFPLDGDTPVRVTRTAGALDVDIDVFAVPDGGLDAALAEYAARPFDLECAPLLRLGLFQVDREHHELCLVAHHLLVDAASLHVIFDEITAGYASLAETGQPAALPPPVHRAPVAPSPGSLAYWRDRLRGYDPAGMRLPMARPVPDPPTFAAGEIERICPGELTGAVAALRSRGRGTDAAVLLAAYLLALRAQGAADDCLAGVMVNTRTSQRDADVGYRVATLPVRVTIDPDGTFADLTGRVAAELTGAVEHADVSFESVVPELSAVRDDPLWWRSGLVRHLFNFRFTPPGKADGPRRMRDVPTGLSRFDLELTVERGAGALMLQLVYSTEAHDRAFAEGLLDRMVAAITQAAAEPLTPVAALELRTAAEVALLDEVNRTASRPATTVPAAVVAALTAAPDAPAVVDADRSLSYRKLCAAATAVARLLRGHGVAAGEVVGVAGPRGPELAAAVLGIWAVGAAYLPLDAEHPADRLHHQVTDAGCRVLLDGHLLPEACRAGLSCPPVPRAGDGPPSVDPSVEAALSTVDPAALAYLIYTSGSTGRPKGVRLTHANLGNVVRHFADLLGAGASTAMLWLTTFAFDISALELFLPLSVGGRVVVAPDAARADPAELLGLLTRAGVTVVQATPTTWRLLAASPGTALAGRDVLCGGEPLPPALARQLRAAGCRAFNVYGPTETTIWSTVAELTDAEVERPSVGRPIAGTRIGVFDPAGRPVAPGVVGELGIAGAGVAQGYHRQPELTAERFRTDPVLGRYYRTGDLARLLPDGRIDLMGRRDRQVKLRAHRIELTEVDAALEEHPEVRAATVVLRGDPTSDGYLAGYVVAQARPGLIDDVWSFVRGRLPGYSLPTRIVVVPALPQTPNGKIDTNALAALEPPPEPAHAPAGTGAGLESRLVLAWSEVLGRAPLDPGANFFLQGGTSLLAVRLAKTASRASGVPVSMGMIFRAPTPAALARLLAESTETPR